MLSTTTWKRRSSRRSRRQAILPGKANLPALKIHASNVNAANGMDQAHPIYIRRNGKVMASIARRAAVAVITGGMIFVGPVLTPAAADTHHGGHGPHRHGGHPGMHHGGWHGGGGGYHYYHGGYDGPYYGGY